MVKGPQQYHYKVASRCSATAIQNDIIDPGPGCCRHQDTAMVTSAPQIARRMTISRDLFDRNNLGIIAAWKCQPTWLSRLGKEVSDLAPTLFLMSMCSQSS